MLTFMEKTIIAVKTVYNVFEVTAMEVKYAIPYGGIKVLEGTK